MQVYYDVMEPVKVGSKYRQVVLRQTAAGFEIGIFEGELKAADKLAAPGNPTKPSFESDIAEHHQFGDRQKAVSEFNKICDEIEGEGFNPYIPQIHGV
jgi:hypothetical protein